MLIRPDPCQARAEQDAVRLALARGLARRAAAGRPTAGPPAAAGPGADLPLDYPGTFAYHFGHTRGAGETAEQVAERGRASARRADITSCSTWRVDPAPPETHLSDSLSRAIEALPAHTARPQVEVTPWDEPELTMLCATGCLLGEVFPDCLEELSALIRQLALLRGDGIAGYTDFGVHGAVFVNRARLTDNADGLPARVRFAEAVVHEGAHVRCNAAGWTESYLADPKDRSVAVDTPLRPDARPLNGLFQQFVVLCRSVELYERVLADARLTNQERGPAARRRELLRGQAAEATATLLTHRAALSCRGVTEVELAAQGVPS